MRKEGRPNKKRKLLKPKTYETLPCLALKRQRDKVFVMAAFKAEFLRAAKTHTKVSIAAARKRFSKLRNQTCPKNVFVSWSSTTQEGRVEEHAEQVPPPFDHLWDARFYPKT